MRHTLNKEVLEISATNQHLKRGDASLVVHPPLLFFLNLNNRLQVILLSGIVDFLLKFLHFVEDGSLY